MKAVLKKKVIRISLLIIAALVSFFITGYYWSNFSLSSISFVPISIIVLAFIYILIQILKPFFLKEIFWWDWLYYIALVAILAPIFVANSSNQIIFHYITDYGMLFLILPILFDTKTLFNGRNK